MLILIGTVPTAYGLLPASQIEQFTKNSEAANKVIESAMIISGVLYYVFSRMF
jgi:hypothetical protein